MSAIGGKADTHYKCPPLTQSGHLLYKPWSAPTAFVSDRGSPLIQVNLENIAGAIYAAVGLLLIGSPIAAGLAVPLAFGVLLIVHGVALLILAFRYDLEAGRGNNVACLNGLAFSRLTSDFNSTTGAIKAHVKPFKNDLSFGAPTFDQSVRPP